jgi:hypothetical protein
LLAACPLLARLGICQKAEVEIEFPIKLWIEYAGIKQSILRCCRQDCIAQNQGVPGIGSLRSQHRQRDERKAREKNDGICQSLHLKLLTVERKLVPIYEFDSSSD